MIFTDIPVISSKDNSRLKRVRAVRDGRELGMMYVEGARLASELIKSRLTAEAVFVSESSAEKHVRLVEQLAGAGRGEAHRVTTRIFDSIADTDNSQGIVVLARQPNNYDLSGSFDTNGLLVYLNKVNNPANLGAVVRTAEAAGVVAVLISPDSAAAFSPKALRASMGSSFRMPIFAGIPLNKAIGHAKEKGIRTIGTAVDATTSYTDLDWKEGSMLVIGSEAHGLDASEITLLDAAVLIPMENDVESLNLAVSTGILLFEAKRQRSA